ncbi:hypothetical protein TVAG_064600 [Trichomonas vaginalis G3]|uniref:Protein kinase domain-containing protein n=1 Tax=Trichomonas vaginalis (strain ATCC PRA-98 / G3) TaxID=412133 RepID=A2EHD5_TRIV3|nr:regulation of centriole replication [Trichomonas vaginalis G3]EAY07913.1 hypothetical protein TVAG_064600 [Trichomonas vaginalis G3]KAI5531225.1 regulation of centriole replication [Trichomonas vaginalis G3]|eukprot:XP_001320136.1 hypothetical protein [Trichomonas vaginalis G3]
MGIAHRDLKPSNLLIDQYNRIKIADFGLAVSAEKNQKITRFGGSLTFSSPEIIKGLKHDPFKADIWALGITFYCLVFGKIPYTATTEDELKQQISDAKITIPATCDKRISIILDMILKPDPDERPTAAGVLQIFNYIRPKKPQLRFPNVERKVRFKSQQVESSHLARKIPAGHRRNSAVIEHN